MNYVLFLLIVLSAVGFFNYHGILAENMQKAIFYLFSFAGLCYACLRGRSLNDVSYPRKAYVLLLFCLLVSAAMASLFHTQKFTVSLIATLPYLFGYAFLYTLLKFDIEELTIIRTFYVLLACSTVVYFCNAATFPQNIFGEPMIGEDTTRGILRVKVVFIEFFPLLLFYAINQWNLGKGKKWLFIMAWMTLMIILSVVRQCILFSGVLAFIFFFKDLSTFKKVAIVSAFAAIILFVLPQIPMFQTMMELSEGQAEENEEVEDIRIQSWRNYTYENQTNLLTPIFGNGIPSYGNSQWGTQIQSENEVSGMFAEDVGWAGFFWYFGAIATGSLIYLLFRAFKRKKRNDQIYLNYWLIYLAITTFMSGPVVYYYKIILIMIVLYLCFNIDVDADADSPSESETEKEPQPWASLTKLPQFKVN